MTSTAVRVALRVRPLTQKEQFSNCTECISFIPNQPQILIGKDHSFTYDYVFDTHSSQQPIYDKSVVPLVEKFVDGFNATILAYGQTGSGKTYSMGTALDENTNSDHEGIVPRFIHDLFKRLASKKESGAALSYQVFVSFLELYNEDLVDLLNHQKKKTQQVEVQIREDVHGQIYWSGVREEPCQTPDDLLRYLSKGSLCRTTGSTDMNSVSSRSHAIFSVIIKQQVPEEHQENATADSRTIISKFHFVDLAGSERLKRTNAQGDRAREGISINSGLLALGNVISALGDDSRKSLHVPYRDSKLTRLLQDSLGGNSQTLMMACVSPSDSNFLETLSTLKYANRARNIKNKVTINQEFAGSSVEVNQLRSQVARLKLELNALRASSSVAGNGKTPSDIMLQNMVGGHNTNAAKALKEEIDRLKERVRNMSDDICRITTERDSLLMERELAQHMGSTSEDWTERRPSFYENNNTINTLPIVAQYQKTIQDLKNELMDVQERLAFSESIRAPLMHAAMAGVTTPHTSKTTTNVLQQQQHSSTTNGKRRLGNKKRRNGSTTTTSRNVTFRSTKRSKVPHVTKKPVAIAASTTDEDNSDIESWLKETMGNIQTSESSGLRVDAKHSISNARSQIDKALKVLDDCKTKEADEIEYDCDLLADDDLFVQLQSEDNASLFGDIDAEFANDSSKSEVSDVQVPQQRAPRSRMVSAEMDDTELAEFYENNPQFYRMVNQIQSDIQVNEDLVLQLEKTEVEYGQMRKKFEQKIYSLRDEILTLRREQQQQQQQQPSNPLAKRRDSAASLNNMNTIRQAYEMKMKALMGQLSDLRRKYTQTSSTIQSSRNQNESMLRALRVNVESLKVEKRRMIKRMKDEAERVKEKLHSHEREIQNLRRKQTKDNEHKRRLERELKQMEITLQKKTDESVVTAQKLKSLVKILKKAVREGGVLDEKLLASCGSLLNMGSALIQSSNRNMARRKRVSKKQPRIPAEARATKKKILLDNALYQFIQGKQAVEEMKQLLAKRNDLSQRKIEYMSERELLLLDEDSKDLSTIDHAFRQVIDENIETVQAEISYLNARIHAIHNDAAAEIMQDEEDGHDEVVLMDGRANASEKRVTFADPSRVHEEEIDDEWLDMDALEERYSLPASAGPDQALETISRLIKSMANDEASLVMESAIDDIVLLRMEEHNNKMTIQQLEKSSQDLRRTLIVMKKAAIETTIENEKKLKRLQHQQSTGPSRRTSMSRDRSCSKLSNHSSPTMEDSSDADSAIDLYQEEQYQHVESLFDKIYNDGINGKIEDYSIMESPLTVVAENELNPYLRPHPTSVSSNRLNAVSAPMKPSTSPLANRRDSMSSPEQFLMQMLQTPKDIRPPPSPLMKPSEFARYQHDRESSTSSIRSAMRRRSSVQSVESLGSSCWSGQQMTRASSGSKLPPAAVPTSTTASELPPVLNRRRAFSFQQPPSTQPPPSMPSTLRRRSLLREIVPPPPQPVMDSIKSPQQYFDNREYSTHGTTFIPALQKQRSYSVLAMHAPQHNSLPRPSTAMRRVDSSPNNSYELRRSAAANNVFDRLSSGHTQASQAKKRPGNYRYSSSSIDDLRTQWANELSQKNNHHDDI